MNTKLIVAIAILVLLGIISFNYYDSSQSQQSLAMSIEDKVKLDTIANQWERNSELASKASTTERPVIIEEMQTLRDETAELKVTPCLISPKKSLLAAMDAEITVYSSLKADAEATIKTDANNVYKSIKKYHETVEECTN